MQASGYAMGDEAASPIEPWSPALAALERRPDYRRALLVVLLLSVAAGAGLRLWNLGRLSVSVDEGFMGLAVNAILERGVPVLDHGAVYGRATPFLYLQAGSAWLIGNGPAALRLPAAVFGILCIPMAYVLGRRMLGVTMGTLLAVLVAFSVWELELSRYGRFYTALQFFWMLAAVLFHGGFIQGRRGSKLGFFVTVFAGMWFHELMILSGTWFALVLPLRGWSWRGKVGYGLLMGAMVPLRVGQQQLQQWWTGSWHAPAAAARGLTELPGRFSGWADVLPVGLPSLTQVTAAAEVRPGLLAAALAAAVLAAGLMLWRARRTGQDGRRVGLALLALSAAGAGNLAAAGLFIVMDLAFFVRRREQIVRGPVAWALAGAVGLGAIWFVIHRTVTGGGWRAEVVALFAYPEFGHHFVHWMLSGWPILLTALLIGAVVLGGRAGEDERGNRAWCVLAMLLLPLTAMCVLKALWFEARYFFHLFPQVMLVAAVVPVLASAGLAGRLKVRSGWLVTGWAAATLAAILVLSQDANPRKSMAVVQRQYGQWRDPIKSFVSWPLHAFYHQDYESACRYIQEHRQPGDGVVVVGPPHEAACVKYYLGQVDYIFGNPQDYPERWVNEQGRPVDELVGAVLVSTLDELKAVLEGPGEYPGKHPGLKSAVGGVWVVCSDLLSEPENWVVIDSRQTYLKELMAKPEFTARDGHLRVRRMPALGAEGGGAR
jgi:hypothetical protein